MDNLKALLSKILPLVLVVVVLLGMGFTIRFQVLALAEARNAASYEHLAISATKARLDTLLQYKADESILQERTARAEQLMPAETGEGAVVRDIQATADAANARFLNVRFGELAPGEKYNEIPMQITFEGRYEELLSLLDGLRSRSRAIRVDELKVGEGDEGLPQIKADIKASAFSLKSS